jgi:peptidoglycan/LPS O-acetylase OafA/YrhL
MQRILQLDGLRGIAILMVFMYHALGIPLLWSGVDLFFVMSGYLITGILLRLKERETAAGEPSKTRYWKAFYSRRARRILPPYFLFLLIVGLFFSIPWSHVWYWYTFFGANIAVAMNLAVMAMLPLWSLAVEEQFYLVWPFVILIAGKRTLRTIAVIIIVAAPVLRAVCTPLFHSHWPIYTLPFFRADTLAWGAFIAISENDNPSWIHLRRPLACLSAVVAGTILGAMSAFGFFRYTVNSIPFNALGYSLIGVVFAGVVIYVVGAEDGFVHWILTRRILRFPGKISYTFYLYHVGVLLLIQRHMHSRGLSSIVAFLITGVIAAASWTFFESPILEPAVRH